MVVRSQQKIDDAFQSRCLEKLPFQMDSLLCMSLGETQRMLDCYCKEEETWGRDKEFKRSTEWNSWRGAVRVTQLAYADLQTGTKGCNFLIEFALCVNLVVSS